MVQVVLSTSAKVSVNVSTLIWNIEEQLNAFVGEEVGVEVEKSLPKLATKESSKSSSSVPPPATNNSSFKESL